MPRHFIPKKVLAERMRREIEVMRSEAVAVACRCEHQLTHTSPPGTRPAGWCFCTRCRHRVWYEKGEAQVCHTEPRLSLPWFRPSLIFSFEPAESGQPSTSGASASTVSSRSK